MHSFEIRRVSPVSQMQNELKEHLHQRFRTLTTLLRIVTCLRSGYLTLPDLDTPSPTTVTNNHHILEAVASILIINLEVVAVMAFSSDNGGTGGLVIQNPPTASPSTSTVGP